MRAVLPCLALLLAIALLPSAAQARESQFTMFEAPAELLSDDAGMRARTLAEIEDLGVHWLRVVLYWHGVAPAADDPRSRGSTRATPPRTPGSPATTAC